MTVFGISTVSNVVDIALPLPTTVTGYVVPLFAVYSGIIAAVTPDVTLTSVAPDAG